MMKIKVSTLEGPLLAEFVAMAQEWEKANIDGIDFWCNPKMSIESGRHVVSSITMYCPDINGGQAMELLEEMVNVDFYENCIHYYPDRNKASSIRMSGETKAIQICRAFVASKFGEYVEVEDAV